MQPEIKTFAEFEHAVLELFIAVKNGEPIARAGVSLHRLLLAMELDGWMPPATF